ncbi:MAG: alpha/beta fold hydrolase [Candidatus Methylomirabilales bacterium]
MSSLEQTDLGSRWITQLKVNYVDLIPSIQAPTLLLWGDAEPISPLAVGEKLNRLFPRAELVVVTGGEHMFGWDRADEVAPHIARHLLSGRSESVPRMGGREWP